MNRCFLWAGRLVGCLIITILMVGCGGTEDSPPNGGSSSSGAQGYKGTSGARILDDTQGYVALSNGHGGVNYEAVVMTLPNFDKNASLKAFKETLYPYLRSSGCGACHNSASMGQAPLHADNDITLDQ